MKTLIIGYGSPIRGDDALGPLAADRLERDGVPAGAEIISRHILTAELVPEMADKDRVIFLDAAADLEPGEVRCQRLEASDAAVSSMAHFLDARELLAWCEALYGRAPESFLVSAGGESFDYSHYELTSAGEQALQGMLDCVSLLLENQPIPAQPAA